MARKPSRGNSPTRRTTGGRKPARRGTYDRNDIRYVATHEAGHAVAAVVLGLGLVSVDIHHRLLPDGGLSLGRTTIPESFSALVASISEEYAMAHVVFCLSGFTAEAAVNRLVGGDIPEREAVRSLVSLAICRPVDNGVGRMTITPEELRRNGQRIDGFLRAAEDAAARLVRKHRAVIARVADLLLERKELTGEEVAAIIEASHAKSD
jgi:ATP-dependent Zn protease